ncbi:MAG: hypothetical protein LKI42_01970, partial [Bacteroidales bacterium]|nr:hypothetical protein [Bacteroidales bacterium]
MDEISGILTIILVFAVPILVKIMDKKLAEAAKKGVPTVVNRNIGNPLERDVKNSPDSRLSVAGEERPAEKIPAEIEEAVITGSQTEKSVRDHGKSILDKRNLIVYEAI